MTHHIAITWVHHAWRVTHRFQLSTLQAIICHQFASICCTKTLDHRARAKTGYGQISAKTRRLLSDHSKLGLVHFALLWCGWVQVQKFGHNIFRRKNGRRWKVKRHWIAYTLSTKIYKNVSLKSGYSMSMFFICWRSPASPELAPVFWFVASFLAIVFGGSPKTHMDHHGPIELPQNGKNPPEN